MLNITVILDRWFYIFRLAANKPHAVELQAMQMIDVYTKFAYEQAAIPVVVGRKSKVETFAGASKTYTIEAMMGDRKALQAGTSHNLGQNFSRAFGTQVVSCLVKTSWCILFQCSFNVVTLLERHTCVG